jgi:hypothetical protein
MLVGFMGKMGSGKTLGQTILAAYASNVLKLPLYANYGLKIPFIPVKTTTDLWNAKQGILALDELHLTMDSRLWTNNVSLSHFITQSRKKELLVIYTTQHIGQVDLRIRQNTDFLIYCERKKQKFIWNVLDYQYNDLIRKIYLQKPERFFNIYDTKELMWPIKYVKYAQTYS